MAGLPVDCEQAGIRCWLCWCAAGRWISDNIGDAIRDYAALSRISIVGICCVEWRSKINVFWDGYSDCGWFELRGVIVDVFDINVDLQLGEFRLINRSRVEMIDSHYLCVSIGRWITAGSLNVQKNLWLCLVIQSIGNADISGCRINAEITVWIARVYRITDWISTPWKANTSLNWWNFLLSKDLRAMSFTRIHWTIEWNDRRKWLKWIAFAHIHYSEIWMR